MSRHDYNIEFIFVDGRTMSIEWSCSMDVAAMWALPTIMLSPKMHFDKSKLTSIICRDCNNAVVYTIETFFNG